MPKIPNDIIVVVDITIFLRLKNLLQLKERK